MTTSITSTATQTRISAGGNSNALVLDATGIVSGLGKNKIINGNFSINQRAISGTVVLAAGIYGHDRFKAGASGCTYTFATALNVTTLTISAGSLIQVIEGLNLQSGPVVLGWQGTAQGKIDAGSYGSTGITGTAVGGTNMSVEFNTGTLKLVQLETGAVSSASEQRPYGMELALCQRYLPAINGLGPISAAWVSGATVGFAEVLHTVQPRVPATGIVVSNASHFSLFSSAAAGLASNGVSLNTASATSTRLTVSCAGGLVAGNGTGFFANNAAAQLLFTGCEL